MNELLYVACFKRVNQRFKGDPFYYVTISFWGSLDILAGFFRVALAEISNSQRVGIAVNIMHKLGREC